MAVRTPEIAKLPVAEKQMSPRSLDGGAILCWFVQSEEIRHRAASQSAPYMVRALLSVLERPSSVPKRTTAWHATRRRYPLVGCMKTFPGSTPRSWPSWIGGVALLLALAEPQAAANPKSGVSIEVWTRRDGQSDEQGSPHESSRRVRLDRVRLETVEHYDAQYGRVGQYRGVSLRDVLRDFAPDASLDLAILHFANGMAIPLAFRDGGAMKRLDPFIARASMFPSIPKKDTPFDRRPIEFAGNKLVVKDRWHPDVAPGTPLGFSPWAHADTLVGIELVATAPYYAQFEAAGEARVGQGLALFRQSCQFCHGVRHVGATFGWDFVDSAVIDRYEDSPANLYHNVAYKPRNAGELGLMMPPLAFLTESAAGEIRQWLQAISKSSPPPYRRPAQAGPRSGK